MKQDERDSAALAVGCVINEIRYQLLTQKSTYVGALDPDDADYGRRLKFSSADRSHDVFFQRSANRFAARKDTLDATEVDLYLTCYLAH